MSSSSSLNEANAGNRRHNSVTATSNYGSTNDSTGMFPFRRHSQHIGSGLQVPGPGPAGKINSLGHFASSYTRAQSFLAIDPVNDLHRARSFFVDHDEEEQTGIHGGPRAPPTAEEEASGLLEHQYHEAYQFRRPSFSARFVEGAAVFDDNDEDLERHELPVPILDDDERSSLLVGHPHHRRPSYLPPPEFGTIVLRESEASAPPGTETEPVIVREVEGKDGKITTVVAGQSTAPQTVFNSVNVLVGVGLLSLSLGFKYSGWVLGVGMLVFSGLTTFYTAKLLARCMDTDHTLVTYADVAYAAYGPRARILTSMLFTLEITGAGVSMVVLFSDSLHALFPQFSAYDYKILAFVILTPLCFLPLRILSVSSILGITCTLGLVIIVLFDGFWKQDSPGSLIQPMTTWLMPKNWMAVPLAIGIFMAPWGGHAVFPNIYRDMRHPQKYVPCLITTYQITFIIDFSMAVLGFLMFGNEIAAEVSQSILATPGYPKPLGLLLIALIAIIPIAKTPLNVRPIVSTLDVLFSLDHIPLHLPTISTYQSLFSASSTDSTHENKFFILKVLFKAFLRVFVVFIFVLFAILFPAFDRVIGLLGCSMCTTICVLGPIAFYFKIFGDQVPKSEKIIFSILFVLFAILAVVGTVWCFLSPETIENGFFQT